MEKKKSQWLIDRRSFLKSTGTGILGAALLNSPLRSLTFDEALAAAHKQGETVVPTFCGMCGPSENCGVYHAPRTLISLIGKKGLLRPPWC